MTLEIITHPDLNESSNVNFLGCEISRYMTGQKNVPYGTFSSSEELPGESSFGPGRDVHYEPCNAKNSERDAYW